MRARIAPVTALARTPATPGQGQVGHRSSLNEDRATNRPVAVGERRLEAMQAAGGRSLDGAGKYV